MYKYNGTGNTGSFAWLFQRISGIIIAICGVIIFYQTAFNGAHNVDAWLVFPVLAFGLWHTFSGFKMITDDYVSCRTFRLILQIAYWGAGVTLFALGLSFI
ncbi:MAG: succinate dehydrogenase [Deferribacteraceae bacterium]|jgi:succinate dehydrogenase / fumarate reductase membrane anchor subunit|nr:succinate dehydrogenase [Deferribacteraceae bacterium]